MNIIIEGPDASGKTTLVEKILKNKEYSVIHGTAKTKNDREYYLDLLKLDNQIFDRFHLSEYIFPQIYGRPIKLVFSDFEAITEEVINSNTIMILFCTSDISILEDRLKARGEYNYLKEIHDQCKLFTLFGSYLTSFGYENFYVIDIAKKDAYEKLDKWLRTKGVNV